MKNQFFFYFYFFFFFFLGGGGGRVRFGGSVGGVRMDVNEELNVV